MASKRKKKKEEPARRLTKEELRERMTLNANGLVEELHTLTIRQLQSEDVREGRLDAKAQGLLGAVSLSLTVAFSLGGVLWQHKNLFSSTTFGLYALALICGMSASLAAAKALFVSKNYGAIRDDDVFNPGEFNAIERDIVAETVDPKDKEKLAQCLYRRYITVQLWGIYRKHFDEHERKAKIIKVGQILFMLFLLLLILIGISSAAAALTQTGTP